MARGGRGKVVPGTASLISVTAGNRKNKEIPIRHSNKPGAHEWYNAYT